MKRPARAPKRETGGSDRLIYILPVSWALETLGYDTLESQTFKEKRKERQIEYESSVASSRLTISTLGPCDDVDDLLFRGSIILMLLFSSFLTIVP